MKKIYAFVFLALVNIGFLKAISLTLTTSLSKTVLCSNDLLTYPTCTLTVSGFTGANYVYQRYDIYSTSWVTVSGPTSNTTYAFVMTQTPSGGSADYRVVETTTSAISNVETLVVLEPATNIDFSTACSLTPLPPSIVSTCTADPVFFICPNGQATPINVYPFVGTINSAATYQFELQRAGLNTASGSGTIITPPSGWTTVSTITVPWNYFSSSVAYYSFPVNAEGDYRIVTTVSYSGTNSCSSASFNVAHVYKIDALQIGVSPSGILSSSSLISVNTTYPSIYPYDPYIQPNFKWYKNGALIISGLGYSAPGSGSSNSYDKYVPTAKGTYKLALIHPNFSTSSYSIPRLAFAMTTDYCNDYHELSAEVIMTDPCPAGGTYVNGVQVSSPGMGYTFNTPTTITGNGNLFDGPIYINAPVHIQNAAIKMMPGTLIIVNPNFALSIDNSTLLGECAGWLGIYLNNSSVLSINNSEVRDAQTAIYSGSNSIYIDLNNTIFDNNHVVMYLKTIQATVHMMTCTLRNPSLTSIDKSGPPPGISIDNTDNTYSQIYLPQAADHNNFFLGGNTIRSFSDVEPGIINYLINDNGSFSTYDVDGGNTFQYCQYGVRLNTIEQANFQDNFFQFISKDALTINGNSNNGKLILYNNTFNARNGVIINQVNRYIVRKNTFVCWSTGLQAYNTNYSGFINDISLNTFNSNDKGIIIAPLCNPYTATPSPGPSPCDAIAGGNNRTLNNQVHQVLFRCNNFNNNSYPVVGVGPVLDHLTDPNNSTHQDPMNAFSGTPIFSHGGSNYTWDILWYHLVPPATDPINYYYTSPIVNAGGRHPPVLPGTVPPEYFINGCPYCPQSENVTGYATSQFDCSMLNHAPSFNEFGEGLLGTPDATHANSGINIYPNPATKDLNISIADQNGNHLVQVIDINGRVVIEKLAENKFSLDVSRLNDGIYLLIIKNNSGSILYKSKFLKE